MTVAVDGHPSALREAHLAGLRPAQEPAPTDTSGNPNPPSPIGGILVFAFVLMVLYVILIAAGNVKRRWK